LGNVNEVNDTSCVEIVAAKMLRLEGKRQFVVDE